MNKTYRFLTGDEIRQLQAQMCMSNDWKAIQVAEGFSARYLWQVRFSGDIRLGRFDTEFEHDLLFLLHIHLLHPHCILLLYILQYLQLQVVLELLCDYM